METQPEQASSAAANKNITSDVPTTTPKIKKNPGRVAAGKKLAEQNKQAREAKKKNNNRSKKTSAPKSKTKGLEPEEKLDSNNSGFYILRIGSLILTALGLYYQRKSILQQ